MAQKEPLASQHELLFWDAENRLAEVQDANGNTQEQCTTRAARASRRRAARPRYTFSSTTDQRRDHRHQPLQLRRPAHRRQARQRPLPPARRPSGQSRRGQPHLLRLRRRARRVGNSANRQHVYRTDATGLLYYNARYYDPALGTFISPEVCPTGHRLQPLPLRAG